MKRETTEWVVKAEKDWLGANHMAALSSRRETFHDQVCFACQQSAEKYLKALAQELGQVVPRTHDLERLLVLLLPHDRALMALRRAAAILTPYAVEFRYPGRSADKRQALAAIRHAEKVRTAVRGRLGLPA